MIPLVSEVLPLQNQQPQRIFELCNRVNNLLRGRNNAVSSFTLTANAATTVISDVQMHSGRMILWSPTTANAAAEIGAGTMYHSATSDEVSFTITHANNAQTDRTFNYVRLG